MSYLTEAFKALDALNEDTFSVSDDGIKKLAEFEDNDDLVDEITVYDADAEDKEDLEDSYVGKVIVDCNVCHSKIYKDKSDVVIDEETQNANIDEECPYCYSTDGFKVIGEVAPMTTETEEKVEVEDVKNVNEVYDYDDKRKDGTEDTLAQDVALFAEEFEYNGSPVFDSDYTRARYVTNGDVSLQLRMDSAFQSFSDEQKARMEKELTAFLDALVKNGYKVKGSPKVNDRFFLISNGWGRMYRYVTIRIVNDGLRIEEKVEVKDDLDESLNEAVDLLTKENTIASVLRKHMDELSEYTDANSMRNAIIDILDKSEIADKDAVKKLKRVLFSKKSTGALLSTIATYMTGEKVAKVGRRDVSRRAVTENIGQDIDEYQQWVDYDMKRYHKISDKTNDEIRKAGLQVVKDKYGDYQVIAGKYDESLKEAIIKYPNGMPVTDIDLDVALNYMYGEDRDMDNNHYTDDEKQRAVNYWLNKTDSSPYKESLKESVKDITITTDDSKTTMTSDDEGKVTLTTEPVEEHKDEGEVIEPVTDETEAEIEANDGEEDIDIEDFDEESFDERGEGYFKNGDENVNSFKTSNITTKDNKVIVEGVVTFDNNVKKNTSFLFESANKTKSGKYRFIGENLNVTKGNKAFSLIGNVTDKKFLSESMNYNYRTKNDIGKSIRCCGTIKRG